MKRNSHSTIVILGLNLSLLLSLAGEISAQEPTLQGLQTKPTKLDERLTAKEILKPTVEPFFEGPVDPETFQLGPGDLLGIFLWRPTVAQFPVRVNAEGEAVIPTVGPVKVTGMSLTNAKEAMTAKVRERFAGAELTISLDEVRTFRVHVCGAVTMPGSYLVPATARVADAILLAGGLLKRPKVEWDTTSAVVASERRIQVLAADTPDHWRPADLLLFEKAGRAQANPYLHDGDVIVVPFREEKDTQVGVFGGVFTPDLHEYAPGDRVTDLIALAGGTLSSANLFASYLVRADGRRMAISDSAALYTEVQPGDRLYVPMKYDPPRFGTVTLKGEIGEPGSYPIEIGKTTLSQVLKDAGGLLPTAAVNSARLIRAPTQFRDAEKVRLLRLRQTGNFTEEKGSHDRELAAAYERWLGTTVVFDLSNLLESASSDDDVLLQDGDMLEIPRYPFGVQILGLVNRSGEITYHENWDLNDYLRAAGGLNRGGWKSQTRVVKASSGSVVLYTPKVRLDPGDIVFVPSKPPGTTWTQVKDGITMASQVATIALIVMTATKK